MRPSFLKLWWKKLKGFLKKEAKSAEQGFLSEGKYIFGAKKAFTRCKIIMEGNIFLGAKNYEYKIFAKIIVALEFTIASVLKIIGIKSL